MPLRYNWIYENGLKYMYGYPAVVLIVTMVTLFGLYRFKNFDIIEFKEIEKDAITGLGKMKHWHIFNVIAKKL